MTWEYLSISCAPCKEITIKKVKKVLPTNPYFIEHATPNTYLHLFSFALVNLIELLTAALKNSFVTIYFAKVTYILYITSP